MFGPQKIANGHPRYKTAYLVKNWPEYEKSLRSRADITVWFSQMPLDVAAAKEWKAGRSVASRRLLEGDWRPMHHDALEQEALRG